MGSLLDIKTKSTKVFDSTNNTAGFKDDKKGITSIVYNHLNLPTKIMFDNNQNITYIYNALGQKVQKTAIGKTTVLQFLPNPEGYYDALQNRYVYSYTDHLGNVRLSYTRVNNVLTVIDESNYYPFGLKHTGESATNYGGSYKYKYNGKELQDELGLNIYDYGARNYDAALGRWFAFDPKAEAAQNWTPYRYAFNNPLIFVDPDGQMEGEYNNSTGNEKNHDYRLLKNGELELINKTDDKFDRVYNMDGSGIIKVDKGFINKKNLKEKASYFVTRNVSHARSAFKFFSDNSKVEFSLAIFHSEKDITVISTTHDPDKLTNGDFYYKWQSNSKMKMLKEHTHSHPGIFDKEAGNWHAYPSRFYSDFRINNNDPGDRDFYSGLYKQFKNKLPQYFNIYVPSAPQLTIEYNHFDVQRR